jgi:hypothetical protein
MSVTLIRPWLTTPVKVIVALFATAVAVVGVAPRAHADATHDHFYIDLLRGTRPYNQYGEQVLLQEGHKVCSAIQHGASEDDATNLVHSDLGAPTFDAFRVVVSIELGMNCFALKNHGM